MVDRLAGRGFVTALHDPKDRRRRAVTLTERGRQVTEAAQLVAAEITAATLAPLSEDERRMVVKLLKKLGSLDPGLINGQVVYVDGFE